MIKKVRFDYEIDESNLFEFLSVVKPFVSNINVSNVMNKWIGDNKQRTKPKNNLLSQSSTVSAIKDSLNKHHELSTREIYFLLRRSASYSFSERSLLRLLVKLCAVGDLDFIKRSKKGGGYKNHWRLK